MAEFLPPGATWSGKAAVVYQLLADADPDSYCLLSRGDYDTPEHRSAPRRLPARYYHLGDAVTRAPEHAVGLERLGIRLRRAWSAIRAVAKAVAAVRRERCHAVVASPDRVEDLPIALAVTRLSGAQFYPYLFDDYAMKWLTPKEHAFAVRAEPFLLRHAAGVIVPNEYMRAELQRRHGIDSTVVRNICDATPYENDVGAEVDYESRPAAIVFTGAVYHAHYGAFRNLLNGIRLLEDGVAELHLYTASDPELLAEHGLSGPIVWHRHAPSSEMPRIQQAAHILFLPLALDSPYPVVVRTSSPAKMAEYLAAARPILVHAPPDSFMSGYFRRHDCGVVVDEGEPAKLAAAIERILGDQRLRKRICAAARQRAETDFDPARARAAFGNLVNLRA